MPTFRVEKTKNYTVMSNHHLRNKEMSLKAKGLLSLMLSLPNDWDFSIRGLCEISVEGESAICSTLKELEQLSYLKRERIQCAGGKFDYLYYIYEQPICSPCVEHPCTEGPCTENQVQLNTKQINTKNINNSASHDNKNHSLFSSKTPVTAINKKSLAFIQASKKIMFEFSFNERVDALLSDYFDMLAQSGTFLPSLSIQKQLEKLAQLTDAEKVSAVEISITRGWKSLDYAISSVQQGKKASFDTAKSGSNQFKNPENDERWKTYEKDEVF